jgi:hypothetical protein
MRNEEIITMQEAAKRKMRSSSSTSFERKETTMKVTIPVKGLILVAALGLACLLPVTAHAQAEIAPDYYDIEGPSVALQVTQVAKTDVEAGKFSLPYRVNCSGMALAPGVYSISVKSDGANQVVTIRRDGRDMNIRARRVAQHPAQSQSELLLRHSAGPGHTLEAVYVRQLNEVLYFDGTAKANSNSGRTERLPIS